jgi:hypothetical protein
LDEDKLLLVNELYRSQLLRWNRRRDDEWKVTGSVWAASLGATVFLAGKLHLAGWAWAWYLVGWLIYVVFWLKPVWTANYWDKQWAEVYRSHLDQALNIRSDVLSSVLEPKWGAFARDWSMRFQAISTAAVLCLACFGLYVIPVAQVSTCTCK